MPDVWRVRGAPAFAALARPRDHGGFRRRSGPVTVTWVPRHTRSADAPHSPPNLTVSAIDARPEREMADRPPPAVAFSISRRVGPAVVRNRLRRRLRADLLALARQGRLESGCYLIGLHPNAAPLDGAALCTQLRAALRVDAPSEASG